MHWGEVPCIIFSLMIFICWRMRGWQISCVIWQIVCRRMCISSQPAGDGCCQGKQCCVWVENYVRLKWRTSVWIIQNCRCTPIGAAWNWVNSRSTGCCIPVRDGFPRCIWICALFQNTDSYRIGNQIFMKCLQLQWSIRCRKNTGSFWRSWGWRMSLRWRWPAGLPGWQVRRKFWWHWRSRMLLWPVCRITAVSGFIIWWRSVQNAHLRHWRKENRGATVTVTEHGMRQSTCICMRWSFTGKTGIMMQFSG